MRLLLLVSIIGLTACSSWPSWPKSKDKPPVTQTEPETPRERLTNDLETYLSWVAVAATLGAILTFALSFKIPGLGHAAYICGLVAASCAMAVYALEWIWLIIGVTFWGLIVWGAYHIWTRGKEIKKHMGISEDFAINFDDREGGQKLKEETKAMHLKHRHKGVKDDGSMWGVE
jgi:hypothetical protein